MTEKFLTAQEHTYPQALLEIQNGRKESHWMWYIFPQLKGLGKSSTAEYYGIGNLNEAREYMAHPILRSRMKAISQAVLDCGAKSAVEIFGHTDAMKLRSSMTLFQEACPEETVFSQVLNKYFQGKKDSKTLALLDSQEKVLQ